MAARDASYTKHFDEESIEEAFTAAEPSTSQYTRDWLEFYSPEEIARRQERWRRERSIRYRILDVVMRWRLKRLYRARFTDIGDLQ